MKYAFAYLFAGLMSFYATQNYIYEQTYGLVACVVLFVFGLALTIVWSRDSNF